MSLYHETAELLLTETGSLRSRIFGRRDLKSPPAQVYALAVESCKWSLVLKEVIENADFLRLERKVTPILSVLLVHDLLLAKRGIALPATHGLRTAVERHKFRLKSELTKARVRRKLESLEEFKRHVEAGLESGENQSEAPYPRWVRVNTLKTTLKHQLETTFADYQLVSNVKEVRLKGHKRLFIDTHIPNLIALSPIIELSKSDAYKTGKLIFQDKASCFPAYLLDPVPKDGDVIDTCSAPGNKTTHLAAILRSHILDEECNSKLIHAFEKSKTRASLLETMINLAGSDSLINLYCGQDFLRTDPCSPIFRNVGALLLDPSCSGSGILSRDESSELHIPLLNKASFSAEHKHLKKKPKKDSPINGSRKRKREDVEDITIIVDDDGEMTALNSKKQLETRLSALSKFQIKLLLHAFQFPAARKITYSTCSMFAEENELVILKALDHPDAKKAGWRILKREEQICGMRDWPVRGLQDACGENKDIAAACIRTNKNDEHGTMGFFVAALIRDQTLQSRS